MPLLALLAMLVIPSQTSTSTPQKTVETFVALIAAKDLRGAAACVKGGGISNASLSYLQRVTKWPAFTVTDLKETELGSRAIVDFHLKVNETSELQDTDASLILTKVGDSWLIEGTQDHALSRVASMFSHPDIMDQASNAAKSSQCLSNVKQIALSLVMFTADYDDVFKLTAENWIQRLQPYAKDRKIFYCPDDRSGNVSYSFNGLLAGKSSTSIASPATTVMIYEGKGGHLNFRHNGRAAVGFADGHAKLIDASGAKNLVWKP